MTDSLLEARNLAKTYDGGNIRALREINLSVAAGEFLAIRGPSGSGKSTLLQLLAGLDTPTFGEVLYRGTRLSELPSLDAYRSEHVGFVFQAFHLLPTLSALENVQIPMFPRTSRPHVRREKAEALLNQMDLHHRLHKYPNQLSAGERQRVAIARSLANDPAILLADEPTGNLDSENTQMILDLLSRIQAEMGMTVVVVTHEEEVAARAMRIVHLRDGSVCF